MEHLANFRDWYIGMLELIVARESCPLEERFIPLTVKDTVFMQHLSFRRGKVLATAGWECLPEDLTPWNELSLPIGDNDYRWWQVSEISPKPLLPQGLNLVCIETNPVFELASGSHRLNDRSEFEIGFTSDEELQSLLECLERSRLVDGV